MKKGDSLKLWEVIKTKARVLKKEVSTLYLACKRPEVPWYAKLLAVIVVGYALSPIDLIPDFVPILGYLDDIILIPAGVALVIKLIPENVLNECREQTDEIFKDGKPKNWIAGGIIVLIWILIISLIIYKIFF